MPAKKPDAALTATQHEILEIIWDSPQGATVTEIWEAIAARRGVTRTTILNLVDRLEKRRWLKRHKSADGFRYTAAVDRDTTARTLAAGFVNDFFGGSASSLVMSLLGNKRVSPAEMENLRRLLDSSTGKADPHRENI